MHSGDEPLHLSVVATSRNDNHGGFLTHRMQHFVDGLAAQCARHRLRAELILVEWNPPAERAPLAEELRWPAGSPCKFRIVTVPPEIHARFDHADRIPLFQMIAKNVGIRRARGRFVLATNVDILFSDEVMRKLAHELQPGRVYRTNRVDVPVDVPGSSDFDEVLAFCRASGFRIHANGTTVVRRGARWRMVDRIKGATDARIAYLIHLLEVAGRIAVKLPRQPRRSLRSGVRMLRGDESPAQPPSLARGARRMAKLVVRRLLRPWPFTNACGDFTLLSKDDWFRLRGYAEWHVFSWHLDSLLIYQAVACGIKCSHLGRGADVFHIEHGRGYTPEGAADLFARLTQAGIPFLTDQDLDRLLADAARGKPPGSDLHFNDPSWGMADAALPETVPAGA
jgi:hypothetical protein